MTERGFDGRANLPQQQVYRQKPLCDICSPILMENLALWNLKRETLAYPTREAMTARDLRNSLRHIALLKVVDDGADFEYRIAGDALTLAYETSLTGKRVSRLHHVIGTEIGNAYKKVCSSREALLLEGWFAQNEYDYFYREILFLPLGQSSERIDHILTTGVFVESDSKYFRDFDQNHDAGKTKSTNADDARYHSVDPILKSWARKHGFQIDTEFKGYAVRSIRIPGLPNREQLPQDARLWIEWPDEDGVVAIYVALGWWHHKKNVTLAELNQALDQGHALLRSRSLLSQ